MRKPQNPEDKTRPDYWLRDFETYQAPLKGGRGCLKCGNPHLITKMGELYCERCGPQKGPR